MGSPAVAPFVGQLHQPTPQRFFEGTEREFHHSMALVGQGCRAEAHHICGEVRMGGGHGETVRAMAKVSLVSCANRCALVPKGSWKCRRSVQHLAMLELGDRQF